MGLTTEEAADELRKAVTTAATYPLGDAADEWITTWCEATGKNGEPRPDIFASEDGEKIMSGLCFRVLEEAGPALDALTTLEWSPGKSEEPEISAMTLWSVSEAMKSGTRLCDSDPPPRSKPGGAQ